MFDLEPGDTGEALLPVHSDRDSSEDPKVKGQGAYVTAPPAGNPLHEMPTAEGAGDTLPPEPDWLTELNALTEDGAKDALAYFNGYAPDGWAKAMRIGRGDYR